MYEKNGKSYYCPVEAALDILGGKWKPLILWYLKDGKLRFSEINQIIPVVNSKMLTKQLRELEKDGVIIRTVYPEIPPKVEYQLSELGKSVIPILNALCAWGCDYLGVTELHDSELICEQENS
ncbi:helix-turn-helix domain-containing protein [Methanospirillum hungatei]|uniref:winged helix-turn-helix transcriptional regulator n=1 Tax=Methanospirillum hungatei TaxID=2203 RepID=UPI0026E95FF9|nr:helix-turn-helix domain-containing protein [Methanospirillum hungatei]MCA1916454.1 helix-turn-helix transcriptional regulator [Methanospirillum hungatei]